MYTNYIQCHLTYYAIIEFTNTKLQNVVFLRV